LLGRVVGIFGVRGEFKILATSIGADALKAGLATTLRFLDGRQALFADLDRIRPHKRTFVAKIGGIDTADGAQALIDATIWARRDAVALSDDEYFDEDLIGCRLVEGERTLGVVVAIHHYPAQDVLELEGGRLVPMVSAFVREIDLNARIVRVELPEGLVEGEPL
jgi:16S rRNA processing protein RimM